MGQNSMEWRDQSASSELAVIKLQLENMQLNLQSAHEEIKFVRTKCEKTNAELVDAQMEAVRLRRHIDLSKRQTSELQECAKDADTRVRTAAKEADDRIRAVEEELERVSGEHSNYARMVFRLAKRCCGLVLKWSNFPSRYSTRCTFQLWVATLYHRRRVRRGMVAAALRRGCGLRRKTLFGWFRSAATQRMTAVAALKKDEPSVSGSQDLGHALGIIANTNTYNSTHPDNKHTNRMSGSPQGMRSVQHSQAASSSSPMSGLHVDRGSPKELELHAANALLAQPLAAGLSELSTQSFEPVDTLGRLKNAYRRAGEASQSTSRPASNTNFPGSVRPSPADNAPSSADNAGPLAWFLQVRLFLSFVFGVFCLWPQNSGLSSGQRVRGKTPS